MAAIPFEIRGVVEGFYGKPWTHQQRLQALEKFSQFGFNTYLIAPKDDPAQRFRWQELLNADRAAQLRELVVHGNTLNVNVAMSVSPGLSVCYSSIEHRQAVLQRFQQQLEMGATLFVLLWDDIDWDLRHPEDIAQYTYIDNAQAEFSNWIFSELRKLEPRVHMMVCPMIYNGRGPNLYIQTLGKDLHPEIDLMWTGRDIRSSYIDSIDADVFAQDALRKPLYWDNFPVNNLSLRFELHMGSVSGREASLSTHARGLLSNPMNQYECSLLPLATIGRYLNDPENYDSDVAWSSAFEELFGTTDDAKALRIFARTVMGSPLLSDPAPDLRRALGEASRHQQDGNAQAAAEVLRTLGNLYQEVADRIGSEDFEFPAIASEVSPWLPKFRLGGLALVAMAECVANPGRTKLTALEVVAQRLDADRFIVFGDTLDGAIAELLAIHQ